MKATLNSRLAECLSALRAQKGWTLDQLAGLSGVSRAALSRLENAEVSPSADVLYRLSEAHGMSLSRLVALTEDRYPALVSRDEQPTWKDEDTGFARREVSPAAASLGAEIIECKMPAGTEIGYGVPDTVGQEHHLVMISGYMRVEIDLRGYDLGPGDALRYRQFGEARFMTDNGQGARYMLCMPR
ncbi:XRE family transcriptional regulator [Cognatishimia sp. F0-27]|uniref:XRE family transcriptional regulator n=1 Tax=Cognatishimia sp. F0-27 TaxID=2816855 RepID=UPI001D0CB25E|nr:XRE family transcriptional regulator [Cognatishimia sp. F0-27]MCC1493177.1 helix-turn-helix domain-containing protein [Cognatishimia sp. F0-27]